MTAAYLLDRGASEFPRTHCIPDVALLGRHWNIHSARTHIAPNSVNPSPHSRPSNEQSIYTHRPPSPRPDLLSFSIIGRILRRSAAHWFHGFTLHNRLTWNQTSWPSISNQSSPSFVFSTLPKRISSISTISASRSTGIISSMKTHLYIGRFLGET